MVALNVFLYGAYCACLAVAYTQVVEPGELLSFIGRFINRFITGDADKMPNPDTLSGFSWVIYKYTYCAFCFSGFITLFSAAIVADFDTDLGITLLLATPVSMTITKLIEWQKK